MDSLPLNYLNRHTYKNGDKYLFISYVHKNKKEVYEDLFQLYDLGLNYWYDKDLPVGEEWDLKVKEHLSNPNCLGVIFYLSKDTFFSQAVEKEITLAQELKNNRKDFVFIPVIIGDNKNTLMLLKDAFEAVGNKNRNEIEKDLPPERIIQILNTFTSKQIYIEKKLEENRLNHLNKILDTAKSASLDLIQNDEVYLDKLYENKKLNRFNDGYIIKFGSYPQKEFFGQFIFSSDGEYEIDGKKILCKSKKYFSYEPIEWQFLKLDQEVALLISTYALSYGMGYCLDKGSCSDFILDFVEKAFTDEEKQLLISKPRLIKEKELIEFKNTINSNQPSDYAKSLAHLDPVEYYWIENNNSKLQKIMTNKLVVIPTPARTNRNAFVRLVIEINITTLLKEN